MLHSVAVAVRHFKISSGVCSKFRPQIRPLLRFWKMDPSLPGVLQGGAVTARQCKISSGAFSQVVRARPGCLHESYKWSWDTTESVRKFQRGKRSVENATTATTTTKIRTTTTTSTTTTITTTSTTTATTIQLQVQLQQNTKYTTGEWIIRFGLFGW